VNYSEIFNDSYDRVKANNHEFLSTFLDIFVSKSDEIKNMFHGVDIEMHKMKLEESLANLILFYVSKDPQDVMIEMAESHKNLHNVKPEMYTYFIDAIIEALEKVDPRFDKDIAMSWRITLSPGIEFMKNY